jgi:hypothetical protein
LGYRNADYSIAYELAQPGREFHLESLNGNTPGPDAARQRYVDETIGVNAKRPFVDLIRLRYSDKNLIVGS